MRSALLASPTYGAVEPKCRRSIHVTMMTAARHGLIWAGDVSQDKMSFMDARNAAAEFLFDNQDVADGIVWIDSDMVPAPDSLWRLMNTVEARNYDFVSGVYHQRRGQHKPVFYRYNAEADGFAISELYEPDKIIRADGCGFGFVWTSLHAIRTIAALPSFSRDRGGWFPDHHWGTQSEDLGFCKHAMAASIPLYVDTGVQVGHLGENEVINRDHYLQALAPKGTTRVQVV